MRLFIHELDAAMAAVREDRLRPAFKALALRVGRIQSRLRRAWDVHLGRMTPGGTYIRSAKRPRDVERIQVLPVPMIRVQTQRQKSQDR